MSPCSSSDAAGERADAPGTGRPGAAPISFPISSEPYRDLRRRKNRCCLALQKREQASAK